MSDRVVANPTPSDVFILLFSSIESNVPAFFWLESKNMVHIEVPIGQTMALLLSPLNSKPLSFNWKSNAISIIAQTTENERVIKI